MKSLIRLLPWVSFMITYVELMQGKEADPMYSFNTFNLIIPQHNLLQAVELDINHLVEDGFALEVG